MAPPISAPSRSVTSDSRSRVSISDDERAERCTDGQIDDQQRMKRPQEPGAQATAAMKQARATICQAWG